MNNILYDARWIGNHGIGRFADELQRRLDGLIPFEARRRPWHPLDPFLLGATLWKSRASLFFSPGYNSPVGWPGQFIFTLHDLNHLCVPENSNALKRAYYQYVIKPACHRAAFVLTVSEYSRGEIAAWSGVKRDRIINVGNGVGAPFAATGDKYRPGYPYLLYVGSRKPHKNLPRLLQAYAISRGQRELRLIVSGSSDSHTAMHADRLGLRESVVFLEMNSVEFLASVYRGATALLFPSLYEGFGLPPLEAMACGTPVMTSNVCSLPEVVGDAAVLVNPANVEEVAGGISHLVADSGLRDRLREQGLRRASVFSWEETARRTANILAAVAGRNAVAVERKLPAKRDELQPG
jgi:glycosyltransferase involved in cell wall biosynthesis